MCARRACSALPPFVLALLLVVLFLVGLNHWQQPVDEELAPAVLALVVIYAVCIAVAIALLPLAGVCLGTGIYQVCAFAKGELRRRIVVMTVLGLVFSAVLLALTLFFLFMFGSLGSLQIFTDAAFGSMISVGAGLCALSIAAVAVQGVCLSVCAARGRHSRCRSRHILRSHRPMRDRTSEKRKNLSAAVAARRSLK